LGKATKQRILNYQMAITGGDSHNCLCPRNYQMWQPNVQQCKKRINMI